jgi:microcystin-dependent protein
MGMPGIATISINFADIAATNIGTSSTISLNPGVLKSFLNTQGGANVGYDIDINSITFNGAVTITGNANVTNSLKANANSTYNTLFVDTANSRIGINCLTTSNGAVTINNTSGNFVRLTNATSSRSSIIGHDASGMFFALTNNLDSYTVRNSTGTALMTINLTGVGIGKAPGAPLDVSGTVKATTFYGDGSQLTNTIPVGVIVDWPSASIPTGWLLCNGQSAAAYPALKAILNAAGNPFGGTTAAPLVPDIRGRTVLGAGTRAVNTTGGAETHALTSSETGLRQHRHAIGYGMGAGDRGPDNWVTSLQYGTGTGRVTSFTQQAVAASSHENMQPYVVATKIIKAS